MSSNNMLMPPDDEEYYVIPTPPVIEGGAIHNDIGFCYDMRHECHENQDSIKELHPLDK